MKTEMKKMLMIQFNLMGLNLVVSSELILCCRSILQTLVVDKHCLGYQP